MADISSLSDADLMALAQPTPAAPNIAHLSDADLMALANQPPTQMQPSGGFPAEPAHPTSGPSGSFLTDVGRRIGTGAANAIGGFLSLPDTAAKGIDALGNLATLGAIPHWAAPALESIPAPGSPTQPAFPDFQTAKNMAFNTTGGTEYVPETWAGRRTQDVINGVMAGGPAQLALGGPRAAAETLPALIGGSATGGQAAEMFPNHPMAAAMLGAIPGMAIGNAVANAPQRAASLMGNGPTTEPYGAFTRLGLPTNLAGTATGEPGLAFAEKFAARMPGSEGAVAEARANLVGNWQDKLNDVANKIGNAATPQEAGTTLQSAATDWLDQFKKQQRTDWGAYRSLVPLDTPVQVPGFTTALDNVLGNFGGADNLAKTLQPQMASRLKEALGADLQSDGTLSSQAVHSTRTALGEILANPQPIEGMGKAAIKQLYGGLSSDIAGEAAAAGPKAQAAFQKANTGTSLGHDILDNYVAPVLQAKSPEQATQFVMSQARQGGTRLSGVMANLPSAAGDVRSYALRNAAANTESPTSFSTALNGRRPMYSPEAQAALFNDPAVQSQVQDLAATGRAMMPAEKDLANSPTATHQTRGLGRVIAAMEMARQGHEMFGMPGAGAGLALGLASPNVLGRAAQATALNPYLAALYGRQIAMPAQNPSMLARVMAAQTLGPRVPPGVAMPASSALQSP